MMYEHVQIKQKKQSKINSLPITQHIKPENSTSIGKEGLLSDKCLN